jgi:hypothetical protein
MHYEWVLYFLNLNTFMPLAGTGSKPLVPQGWQREILFKDNQKPKNGPCTLRASTAKFEQDGTCLHD